VSNLHLQLQAQQAASVGQIARESLGESDASLSLPEKVLDKVQDMEVCPGEGGTDGVLAPIAAQVEEPQFTRRKIQEFLTHHNAYELIPESGKVVLLDIDLPLRQAFHALHEQGIASATLYDSETGEIAGIISASDFITTLQRLRSMVSNSSNPMSEAEMDQHTIRGLREELTVEGRPPKALKFVTPNNTLVEVVRTLYENHCSTAPVLHQGSTGNFGFEGPDALHMATLAGVLACLMRHFRASLASLPLLAQPLRSLPVGTWAPESSVAINERQESSMNVNAGREGCRQIAELHVVKPSTPLTVALGTLLDAGVSCLPVVDDDGALVDIYARADITMLAKGNAYSRLQFEDVTVGQALALSQDASPPPQLHGQYSGGKTHQWTNNLNAGGNFPSPHELISGNSAPRQRVYVCTQNDAFRTVVERLAIPGVRRVVVVHPESKHVEGIISLSDIAAFMLT
jgi:5'-AMP-activated protein kinase regulatory gamma subunit